ncbi:hypothetical protein ACMFMG_001305 [Clarireedia jacksonii]
MPPELRPITHAVIAKELANKNRTWLEKIDKDQEKEIREATLEKLMGLSCRTQSAQIREILDGMHQESVSVIEAQRFSTEVLSIIQKLGYTIEKGVNNPELRSLKTSSRKILTRLDVDVMAKNRGEKVEVALRKFVGVVEQKEFYVEVYGHRSGFGLMRPVIYISNKNISIPPRTKQE